MKSPPQDPAPGHACCWEERRTGQNDASRLDSTVSSFNAHLDDVVVVIRSDSVLENTSPRLPSSSCERRDVAKRVRTRGGEKSKRKLTDVDIVSSFVSKSRTILLDLTRIRSSSVDYDLIAQGRERLIGVDEERESSGERRTVGRLYRAQAMRAAGMFLSQPGIRTPASY